MALETSFAARFANSSAGNADLNPTPDSAIDILFTSVDPDGLITGDLLLDNPDPLGTVDPNTWVSIDGGANWYQFDVLFYGTINPNNTGNYDFSPTDPNFNGLTLVSIQLNDPAATELFFYPGQGFTTTQMDLFPNGGVDINFDATPPPPPVCFVSGTWIAVGSKEIKVDDIKVGSKVSTRDHGLQSVVWVGQRKLTGHIARHLLPIRISAGALGNDLPKRDLLVSPQHRVLLNDWRAELLFGQQEVLVAAKHLVNDTDIRVATDLEEFEYFHIMFDDHQTIFSEGLPTESFHPGDMAMKSLSEESRAEVLELFPELAENTASYGPSTHVTLKAFEAQALNAI